MLTAIPPAFLLIVALIYLPYAAYIIRRLHSAQRVIEINHSLESTQWPFQQKEYDENKKHLKHYSTFFWVSLWIVACCSLELFFGYHTRFMPLDYCILCVGSLAAMGLYLATRPESDIGCTACTPASGATAILCFCAIYAFSWEFAVIMAAFGGAGWLFSPETTPKA